MSSVNYAQIAKESEWVRTECANSLGDRCVDLVAKLSVSEAGHHRARVLYHRQQQLTFEAQSELSKVRAALRIAYTQIDGLQALADRLVKLELEARSVVREAEKLDPQFRDSVSEANEAGNDFRLAIIRLARAMEGK